MVNSKNCFGCNKKCSGNVLRYQDHYYHKQCFKQWFEQGEGQQAVAERERELQEAAGAGADLYAANASSSPALVVNGNGIGAANDRASGGAHNDAYDYNQNASDHNRSAIFANHNNNTNHYADENQLGQRQQQQQQHSSGGKKSPLLSRLANLTSSSSRNMSQQQQQAKEKSQTIDARSQISHSGQPSAAPPQKAARSATLPHSISSPANGFLETQNSQQQQHERISQFTSCAGCHQRIKDGQALIALDLHWHVWCFKCSQCQAPLHGEYVAKDGKAYCEKDYQRLFGVTCVYCKRYITGKVLQAGEAHHFHPSCARCSKCGDPFVPGEEMYLQAEVTWHPRCGPGPEQQGSATTTPLDELVLEPGSRSQLRASRAQSPSLSSRSQSRSASPFSFMSRQYGCSSPGYADSEAVGDLSRVYTISYLNADPTQGYLRRPIEPNPPKSPQFSRPTSSSRSRSSSRSQQYYAGSSLAAGGGGRERSVPRGMYSVLSGMRGSAMSGGGGSSLRARSPSMNNSEAIQLAAYPSGQKPSPDSVPKIERDDFPAPPFPYTRSTAGSSRLGGRDQVDAGGACVADEQQVAPEEAHQQQQERASRPKSREFPPAERGRNQQPLQQQPPQRVIDLQDFDEDDAACEETDPRLRKEEEELSKIANGIGKIFLQTLKEREKLRAWKRANLDPRNASRTPSATRELASRPLRYDNPTNASPSRDMDRPRPWEDNGAELDGDVSPTRTRSSLGRPQSSGPAGSQVSPSGYGYRVVQANRQTPRPGYGLAPGPPAPSSSGVAGEDPYYKSSNGFSLRGSSAAPATERASEMSFVQQQRLAQNRSQDLLQRAAASTLQSSAGVPRSTVGGGGGGAMQNAHLRRSMPNVSIHNEGPPKLYPYHLLAVSNYRLPPGVDRCHLERHLSNEEFQYIFHCDRLEFYRLPEWKRNELKRRAKLF